MKSWLPFCTTGVDSIHAIALMNLGEVATGVAMYTALPRGGRGIITQLCMTYKKKARGSIIAELRVSLPSGSGRHDVQITAQLSNQRGELVAVAQAIWTLDLP